MRSRRLMNQINIVPYVDVMLVLLVIFMVTAPLVNPGVVDLPSVGKSSQPPATPLEVIVRRDQSLMRCRRHSWWPHCARDRRKAPISRW